MVQRISQVLLIVMCGCISEQVSFQAENVPFQFLNKRKMVVGPVVLRNIAFHIEVPDGDNGQSIRILPQGIFIGSELAVSCELYRQFGIGGRMYRFPKQSKVFVLRGEGGGSGGRLAVAFHGAKVRFSAAHDDPFVLIWRINADGEQLEYRGAKLRFHEGKLWMQSKKDENERLFTPAGGFLHCSSSGRWEVRTSSQAILNQPLAPCG